MTDLTIAPHPTLRASAFCASYAQPLGSLPSPEWLTELLKIDAAAPVQRTEELRTAVRNMLRHGGYKPTGRGKPASEYLVRAAEENALRSINLAVDICNVVSLHSGLPISVIDADRAAPPWRIAIASAGEKYVFNPAGQEIDLSGLLCLFDAEGPCGNAVKDSQRTKTSDESRRTLTIIWGCAEFEDALKRATAWYYDLLDRAGVSLNKLHSR
jgi:DNA/RNA-binding domain of Phe-tRNA-synthetase-like protein